MTLPTVSIGVTTHSGRAERFYTAAMSVLAQTYAGRVQLVIINDGAHTDETPAMCEDLVAQQTADRPVLLGQFPSAGGIARAKNAALRLATGELRGLLDSDDWYRPSFVERCVAVLDSHPNVVAVYTDNQFADQSGAIIEDAPAGDWAIETLLQCGLRGDCYLARQSALAQTKLHDERFQLDVDYDLFYQLARLGPLRRIAERLQVVTQHPGRTSRGRARGAYWHAAGLGKHGFAIKWALQRAAGNRALEDAVHAGYAFGVQCAEDDRHALARA